MSEDNNIIYYWQSEVITLRFENGRVYKCHCHKNDINKCKPCIHADMRNKPDKYPLAEILYK